ncbi:MAG: hypothetical protein ACLFR8_08135 [Alkalispirochaeta sp.]
MSGAVFRLAGYRGVATTCSSDVANGKSEPEGAPVHPSSHRTVGVRLVLHVFLRIIADPSSM